MRRFSPYNYAWDNPVVFIDPDGMFPTTDIYNLKGKKIGTDGVKNNQKVIALNKSTADKIEGQSTEEIKKSIESGSYGTNVVDVPSTEIINGIKEAVAGTDKDGKERGFVMATDGTKSATETGTEGKVGTNKNIKSLQAAGKEISGSFHTHGPGKIVLSADKKNFHVEGGHKPSSDNDVPKQASREASGLYNGPSIVAGTKIEVTATTSGTDNKVNISTTKTKVLTFHSGTSEGTTVNQKKFIKAAEKINDQ